MRGDIALFLRLLAVIGGAVVVAVVFVFGDSDGADDAPQVGSPADAGDVGGNLCDRPLPALGSGPITEEKFDAADAGLDQAIRLAEQGDASGTALAFLTEAHDFTHDVDAPLRNANEGLAKDLCNAVAQIEGELAFGTEAATIAEHIRGIRDLLRKAAAELGFATENGL